MMPKPVILIADPDIDTIKSLRNVLKADYEVVAARDGSRALEQAVLRYPDLILFDRRCQLIGATQFVRILRTNPRTEEIPVVILSDAPLAAASMPGFLQGVLIKPLNLDEVRAHIASVLRKLAAVRGGGDDGAVSGSLDQISMPDLLQIFSVNRRSGCLQLFGNAGEPDAMVYLYEGRIEEALAAGVCGEKVLYRLLGRGGGRFAFLPGRRAPSVSLHASTDTLLMEGMRQCDELMRLLPEMPSASAQLERVVPRESLPEGLHPVTSEIIELVELYPRIGDLVDHAKGPDLEVYLALRALLGAGILRAIEAGTAAAKVAVLASDEVMELRGRLRRAGLPPTFLPAPKVAVLTTHAAKMRLFCTGLPLIPGWQSADLESLYRYGRGAIGQLQLDTGFVVSFYAVSCESSLLPLAYGLSAGTVAAIVLGSEGFVWRWPALSLFEEDRRAGLLIVRESGEPLAPPTTRRVDLCLEAWRPDSSHGIVRAVLTKVAGRESLRGGVL